ncbi:hypothetical protein XANCAGTX0491_004769 [Xanthoria calcicola]
MSDSGGKLAGTLSAAESNVEYGYPNLIDVTDKKGKRPVRLIGTTRKRAVRRKAKLRKSEYDFIRSPGGVEPLIHRDVLDAYWMALVSFITSVDVKDRNF